MMRSRNPWLKLMGKVRSAKKTAPYRVTLPPSGIYPKELLEKRKETKSVPITIDEKYLESTWDEQDGNDYWFARSGIYEPINPMDIFSDEGWYPWAPSVDRLDQNPDIGYVPGNICITFRIINFGRCKYAGNFDKVMERFIRMCDGKSPTTLPTNLFQFLK